MLKKEKRGNNFLWSLAVIAIFVLIILNLVMFDKENEYDKKLTLLENSTIDLFGKTDTGIICPDAEGGVKDALLQIKYFYSDFCPWCQREESVLQKIIKDYGDLVHIEWYGLSDCSELVKKYKVSGVPTFVFSTYYDKTEYSYYGFIYEEDLIKLICDVTGGC